MNTESDILDKARKLLMVWGKWMRTNDGKSYRISYPSSAAFTHAGEEREEPVPVADNPIAEEVDRALCRLKAGRFLVFKAILCEYYFDDMKTYEAAKYCRCGETEFRKRREQGEFYVAGVMLEK